VRALLIDKDQRPRWCPDRLDDVSDAMVDGYFAALPEGDLPLGGARRGMTAVPDRKLGTC
jgi:enoyl-CoA hydratase